MNKTFTYDEVPYPSYTFPQTHPDRLSTIAAFYGIDAAPPEDRRVLELGCGDGTNLVAMAYALPSSSFVGIDLSEVHINDGKLNAGTIGISNIDLRQGDVVELDTNTWANLTLLSRTGFIRGFPVLCAIQFTLNLPPPTPPPLVRADEQAVTLERVLADHRVHLARQTESPAGAARRGDGGHPR